MTKLTSVGGVDSEMRTGSTNTRLTIYNFCSCDATMIPDVDHHQIPFLEHGFSITTNSRHTWTAFAFTFFFFFSLSFDLRASIVLVFL
jgi:hypothetical protein